MAQLSVSGAHIGTLLTWERHHLERAAHAAVEARLAHLCDLIAARISIPDAALAIVPIKSVL